MNRPLFLDSVFSHSWDFIPLPIFVYDTKGALQYVNIRCKEVFNIRIEEKDSTETNFFSLANIVHEPITENFMAQEVEKQMFVYINPSTKAMVLHHQVNAIKYTATITKLLDDNKINKGFFVVLQEESLQDHAFNMLKEANENLRESEEIKNTFLANFNHEVRTPLNAIIGFSELMCDTDSKEKKKEYMDFIYSSNEQLLRIVSDILDLSKIDVGYNVKPQKKDFAKCFNELALSLKERNKNKDVEIEIVSPFRKILSEVDFPRIAQVITNFTTNAMKFTPKGKITIGYSYENGIMEVYVKDTGIGIPKEKQHIIFERFQKVNPFSKGSGLGLSIVKALMAPFGVECGFESTFGKGSYFWARGPLIMTEIAVEKDEEKKEENAFIPSTNAAKPQNRRILVAEDDDTNFFLLSQILGDQNTLVRAMDGQEAVLISSKQSFDLILMDIRMPIVDGFKATSMIRRKDKTVPIIALSSNSLETDNQYAIEVGCNAIMEKPVRKKNLFNIIADEERKLARK